MGINPVYASWVTLYLPKYTIKSPDRTHVFIGRRHTRPLQVGQSVDFRIEGRSVFIKADGAKEIRFGLAEETLTEPAPR
jgi:hypothetical protein